MPVPKRIAPCFILAMYPYIRLSRSRNVDIFSNLTSEHMIHFTIRESFSDRPKTPQVGIEHRSAENSYPYLVSAPQ